VTVFVKKVESYIDVFDFIREAFETLLTYELPEKILVKPNFLKWERPEAGCTTHPEVVKAVAAYLNSLGKEVLIAEGGFTKGVADRYFSSYGFEEYGRCINLNRDKFVSCTIDGEKLKSISVAKTAFELAKEKFFISIPKLKVHHLTTVTLGIKNNMGFLKKPAINMHRNINWKLVDLLKIFNPPITIIDGITGGENSESNTKPVEHRIMIAGDNVVEVDAVGAYLMGFEPEEVDVIRLASASGYGECRIGKIDIDGLSKGEIEELRIKYSISGIRRFLRHFNI